MILALNCVYAECDMSHTMWCILYGKYNFIRDKNRENLELVMKFYKDLILRCRTHQISDQMVAYQDFLDRVHFRQSIQGGYKIK